MNRFIDPIVKRAQRLTGSSSLSAQGVYGRKMVNKLNNPTDYMNALHRLRFQLKYIMDKKLYERRELDDEIKSVQREMTAVRKMLKSQMEFYKHN